MRLAMNRTRRTSKQKKKHAIPKHYLNSLQNKLCVCLTDGSTYTLGFLFKFSLLHLLSKKRVFFFFKVGISGSSCQNLLEENNPIFGLMHNLLSVSMYSVYLNTICKKHFILQKLFSVNNRIT